MIKDRITITVDVTAFREALDALADAFGKAATAATTAAKAIQRGIDVVTGSDERWRYGWQVDRISGGWVSPVCAAWIHEGCPLPDRCQCTSPHCTHPQAIA